MKVAVNKALLDVEIKTKTLNTEVIYNLSHTTSVNDISAINCGLLIRFHNLSRNMALMMAVQIICLFFGNLLRHFLLKSNASSAI